jgi:hypothetical protein
MERVINKQRALARIPEIGNLWECLTINFVVT